MTYPKLINFELFYLNGNYSPDDLENKKFQLISEEIDSSDSDEIIGLLLNDGFLYIKNNSTIKTLLKVQNYIRKKEISKFKLLSSMCLDSSFYLKDQGINAEVEFFNFPHWIVAKSHEHRTSSQSWNSSADKFLFLGGVPSRNNRIVLLSKLYDNNLLNQAEWSFFPPWTEDDKQWCRQSLSHYSDNEYDNFLKFAERKIDNVYINAKDYSRLSGLELKEKKIYEQEYLNNVGYIDQKIFTNTLFSIVSEGNAYPPADDFNFLTEKIWRSVVNKHPFILVGYTEQIDFAKKLGLKTFEDYFLISDYYKIKDELLKLDAVVKNTQHFLSNYKINIEKINQDIEHNYKVFWQIFKESKKQIFKFSKNDQQKYFDHCGWAHLIRIPNVD